MEWIGWVVGGAVAMGLAWLALYHFLKFGREVHAERARELFRLQRERLQDRFVQEAATSGKPRGLRWLKVEWDSNIEFSRDRATDQITAFVGVTVEFEAIEGGDMEGVAAVSNLRDATAVFFHDKGVWRTVGRALFNMNPQGALEHLNGQFEPLPAEREGTNSKSSL